MKRLVLLLALASCGPSVREPDTSVRPPDTELHGAPDVRTPDERPWWQSVAEVLARIACAEVEARAERDAGADR